MLIHNVLRLLCLQLQQLQRHERMLGRQNDRLYGVERRNADAPPTLPIEILYK